MASFRSPIGELTTLATAEDLNGTVDGTQELDLQGAAGAIIIQRGDGLGTGTAGIDVIEFSVDGIQWATAVAANIDNDHAGLLLEDGSAAAAAGAALNAAGIEPVGAAVFSLGPVDGPFTIRCARGGAGAGGTAWATSAPSVVALRLG